MENKKIELLAPAGSKEAFIAAVRAGADSIYLGVEGHNARLNADKFNFYDIEVLTDYAHTRNVKVYLAFNTLIKHGEIYDAVKTIERIGSFKPDALILQDAGLSRIIKEKFPHISMHASTQMSVHNSAGVETLAAMGFKRVILARELSRNELKIIAQKAKVELEVFCHGALCFSVSGMCLFSSYIGSRSGNRGWCTQPCRRIWKTAARKGYLFSPKDLELAGQINALKTIGIKALKIEGRMRSSEYVYNVVRAYRLLIDASQDDAEKAAIEAERYLSRDWARSKTLFHFTGAGKDLFSPDKAQCLGKNIGCIVFSNGEVTAVKTDFVLKEGDRLRVTDTENDKTVNIKLAEFEAEGGVYKFKCGGIFRAGSQVFKAGDADWDEKDIAREKDSVYESHKYKKIKTNTNINYPDLIARQWLQKSEKQEEFLWIKIADTAWLELLPVSLKKVMTVLCINNENIYSLKALSSTLQYVVSNFSCELPPYISEKELQPYSQLISEFNGSGIKFWILNNISHFGFFSPETPKTAGSFLYTMNAFSARVYKDLGVKYFVTSWEDDFLNIRRMAQAGLRDHLITYLFGYPPLARSRMLGRGYLEEGMITNNENERFSLRYDSGSGVIIPFEPVMNFTARKKLADIGICNFGIDLSFVKPDREAWEELYGKYINRENLLKTNKFNFKGGLK